MTYNLHQLIRKYALPVKHQRYSVVDFLSQYYNIMLKEFIDSASAGFEDFPVSFYQKLSMDIIPKMRSQCNLISEILEFDQAHKHSEKREKFNYLMQMLRQYEALRYILANQSTALVRIRLGNELYERKDLFHIPYYLRHLVSSQRFSIPGTPALYLSIYPEIELLSTDAIELSWIECGMPKTYYACLFQPQKELYFLHFGKKGTTYLWEYDNAKSDEIKQDRLKAIEEYLLTLPLRIACSISTENKLSKGNVFYYEEYMIPQLLTEWIQQSTRFDGLTYQSASILPEAEEHDSYNVVIPTKDFDTDSGYDKRLLKIFKLSKPQKFDIFERIKKVEDEINGVYQYTKELKEILTLYSPSERHPYRHLAALCDSFYSICSELKRETESNNIMFPFQQLDTLCRASTLINISIQKVQTADEWVCLYKGYKGDTTLTENDYQIILKGFCSSSIAFMELRDNLYPNLKVSGIFKKHDYEYIL